MKNRDGMLVLNKKRNWISEFDNFYQREFDNFYQQIFIMIILILTMIMIVLDVTLKLDWTIWATKSFYTLEYLYFRKIVINWPLSFNTNKNDIYLIKIPQVKYKANNSRWARGLYNFNVMNLWLWLPSL